MVSATARSHPGRVRSNNEDAYVCQPERGLFAVIDGMGGEAAGELAAAISAQVIGDVPNTPGLASETLLSEAMQEARRRILAHAQTHPEHKNMGAVASAVRIDDDGKHITIAHVGDTRVFLVNANGVRYLTTDHVGPRPENGKKKSAVSRDLGREDLPPSWVETRRVPVRPQDLILLCSDGLYDVVPDDEFAGELAAFHKSRTSTEDITARLLGLALSRGGPDNITVIAVRMARFRRRRFDRRMGWTLSLGVLLVLLGALGGALLHFKLHPKFPSEVSSLLQLRAGVTIPDGQKTIVHPGGQFQLSGTGYQGERWELTIEGNAVWESCNLHFSDSLTVHIAAGGSLSLNGCSLEANTLQLIADPAAQVHLQNTRLAALTPPLLQGPISQEAVILEPAPAPPAAVPEAVPEPTPAPVPEAVPAPVPEPVPEPAPSRLKKSPVQFQKKP